MLCGPESAGAMMPSARYCGVFLLRASAAPSARKSKTVRVLRTNFTTVYPYAPLLTAPTYMLTKLPDPTAVSAALGSPLPSMDSTNIDLAKIPGIDLSKIDGCRSHCRLLGSK